MNGKIWTVNSDYDYYNNITISGKLTIIDSVGNGELNTMDYTLLKLNNGSSLNISGIIMRRTNSSSSGALISGGGTSNINHSTLQSDNSEVISLTKENAIMNITDSTIIDSNTTAILNASLASTLDIKNSTISSPVTGVGINPKNENSSSGYNQTNATYLCNVSITDAESDFKFLSNYIKARVIYSDNSTFISGSNIPTFDSTYDINVTKSNVICKEG